MDLYSPEDNWGLKVAPNSPDRIPRAYVYFILPNFSSNPPSPTPFELDQSDLSPQGSNLVHKTSVPITMRCSETV